MKGIIYKVTNTQTNEVYIGATSKSIDERQQDHFQKSLNGLGYDFQNAINTYGTDVFTWEQIDTAQNSDDLARKEIAYIAKYNSLEKGYNCDKGGGFKKTVYKYNLDGKLSETFNNLSAAADSANTTKKQISKACWNVNQTCKGFLWSYNFEEPFLPKKDLRKKGVMQYNLEGYLLANYTSASEASRQTGVSKTCITRCCRGEREQSGGFKWKCN